MIGRLRRLIGISVFWFGLSMLFDGMNTLVLPDQLRRFTDDGQHFVLRDDLSERRNRFVGLALIVVTGVAMAVRNRPGRAA